MDLRSDLLQAIWYDFLIMADLFSKERRSSIMSAIKSNDSVIERKVAKLLKQKRIRTRHNDHSLPGKPDFSSKKSKTVIFVDSCFWHGCRYHGSTPKSNVKFWANKISRNKERDREINREYKRLGWRIIRIWEHSLRHGSHERVENAITALLKDAKIHP